MPLLIIVGVLALAGVALYAKSKGVSITAGIETVTGVDLSGGGDGGDPNDPLTLALPLIKKFEGFSASAYPDPPGQTDTYSIGYGHQIRPNDPYDETSTITEDEATSVLRVDVGSAWTTVSNSVTVDCTPQQSAALISLCFNIGAGNFTSSTLLRDLNSGDTSGAADQFAVWNKATIGGVLQVDDALVSRRQQEQALFSSTSV